MKCAAVIFNLLGILASQAPAQQPDLKTTLLGIYTRTFGALQKATNAADIERLVNAIDTPDWTGIGADGRRMSRDEAKRQLVNLLLATSGGGAQPPSIELLWVNQSGDSATAVAWVFGKSEVVDSAGQFGAKGVRHEVAAGALVRDSWVLTKDGWRRRMHEKIFPNRVLAIDGKGTIFPGRDP
jgi:hypothetical protein